METLTIQCPQQPGRTETLHCTRRLREVPRRRVVCAGTWEERPVIIKIFYAHWKAHRHVKREWNGLEQLQYRNLRTPRPLFYGRTSDHHWVLVTEEITDSASLLDCFRRSADPDPWDRQADLILHYLARMHEAGVLQQDLHPGNFLCRGETLYALDPAQMRWLRRPVARRPALRNLAVLACSLPGINETRTRSLLEKYLAFRCWQPAEEDFSRFRQDIENQRQRVLRRSLEKTMRNSTGFLALQSPGFRGMFRRDTWDESSAHALAKNMEAVMQTGDFIKRGNTCTVCRLQTGGRDIVIKRYNHKGWWHSLRHTLKGSRARKCWQHGYRLTYSGVPTALPLAFLEVKTGPFVRQSYILNEFVEGVPIDACLADPDCSEQQKEALRAAVRTLLKTISEKHMSHHDLKASNILIRQESPVLIDLDSMRTHWFAASARPWGSRMIRQFEEKLRRRLAAHAATRGSRP